MKTESGAALPTWSLLEEVEPCTVEPHSSAVLSVSAIHGGGDANGGEAEDGESGDGDGDGSMDGRAHQTGSALMPHLREFALCKQRARLPSCSVT